MCPSAADGAEEFGVASPTQRVLPRFPANLAFSLMFSAVQRFQISMTNMEASAVGPVAGLDALPPDVLFSIASRYLPAFVHLVSASRSLRRTLMPILEACVSLRLSIYEVTSGVAELLARLPRLEHVWIGKRRGDGDSEHMDWSKLRVATHVDLAEFMHFQAIEVATLVAPTMRRNALLSGGDILTTSTVINIARLRSGDYTRWSDICTPRNDNRQLRDDIPPDRPRNAFTVGVVAGMLSVAPPPPLHIDLIGLPRECGTALSRAELRLRTRLFLNADQVRRGDGGEHPSLSCRVQLNALRVKYPIHNQAATLPLLSAWANALRSAASRCRRIIGTRQTHAEREYYSRTRSPISALLVLLIALAFGISMRVGEQAWAASNGHPEGARIGNLLGRDRPGNDLTVALREHMLQAGRLQQA